MIPVEEIHQERYGHKDQTADQQEAKLDFLILSALSVIVERLVFLDVIFPEGADERTHAIGQDIKGALVAGKDQQTGGQEHNCHNKERVTQNMKNDAGGRLGKDSLCPCNSENCQQAA